MDTLSQFFSRYLTDFSILEYILLSVCTLLILFSRPILIHIFHIPLDNAGNLSKLKLFRAGALLTVVALLLNHFIFIGGDSNIATKMLGIIMVAFCAFWGSQIMQFFIRRQYGRVREVGGEKVISDSYNSRLLSVVVTAFVAVFALIGVIQVLGFDSLLEAGGVIGVLGVILALTQGSWAPDIISGLIIMNSDFLDEGDVVSLNNGELVAQVFRTKLFHTELLNLVNNNRILLNNANLRSKTIQNLSKFASAKGYREKLSFKIGYDDKPADVRAMFQRAMDAALKDDAIGIEENHDMEVRVLETGDYAIEWGVFYYTKDMKKMIRTRQLFCELILQESLACGISLATPDLYQRVSDAPAIAPAFKINDNPSNFLENT